MKDFAKSIVGNTKVGNNIPDSQINGPSAAEIREIAGRIYKTDMREDDLARAVSFELAKKYKSFQTNTHLMDMVKEVLKKFKTGNKKVGNGILKVWEDNRAIIRKDTDAGIYEIKFKQTGKTQIAKSLEEAQKIYKAESSGVGNETLHEYATSKPRVINEDKTGIEPFFKKLAKDGEERAEKDDEDIEKVGNQSYKFYGEVIDIAKTDTNTLKEILEELRALHEQGDFQRAIMDELRKRKVGNKKLKFTDKKDGLKEYVYDEENDKGYIYYDGKLEDTIPHAGQGWLNLIKQKAFSSGVMNKVGNTKDKNDRDMKIGDMVDVHGKKGKIQKIITAKDSRDDVIEVFFNNSGTYNPDRTDRFYANECTKIGNSKTGNSAFDDGAKKGKEDKNKGKLITAAGFEYHAPGYSSLSFKEKEEYRKGYYSTNDLKKEDIYKWGNSSSDDKFAYVMREFDQGKLKTPDGKIVTDPAQAKAIAYSESKKTENGLARARNAMACNKKVKNSAVREYKHSDGRVAQIDFNEDGSDADMSIYEGTKEIEQKNFSTIRDAEQYVTSHGFKRI